MKIFLKEITYKTDVFANISGIDEKHEIVVIDKVLTQHSDEYMVSISSEEFIEVLTFYFFQKFDKENVDLKIDIKFQNGILEMINAHLIVKMYRKIFKEEIIENIEKYLDNTIAIRILFSEDVFLKNILKMVEFLEVDLKAYSKMFSRLLYDKEILENDEIIKIEEVV